MYIDTHTKESMINSVSIAFNISERELEKQLRMIVETTESDDDYRELLDNFIEENLVIFPTEILLFHLSRRLRGMEDSVEGRNLANLLTTENEFSNLLKKAGCEFYMGEQHIETLYKGKLVDWDMCQTRYINYMKSRLGYFKGREDYCFNGFAFKDLLYKNTYARSLQNIPEFLDRLIQCLECQTLANEYMENSRYYCYEYKIPLEYVVFDKIDTYTYEQKQKYLIRNVLQRIIMYQNSEGCYLDDSRNPRLRLKDDYILPAQYYVGREEITKDMLSYY